MNIAASAVDDESEITVLRRRVTELELELEAWRDDARRDQRRETDERRVAKVSIELGITGARARLLLHLLDHASTPQSKEILFNVVRPFGSEATRIKTVDVAIHHVRRALARAGFPDVLRTVHNYGFYISRQNAAFVLGQLDLPPKTSAPRLVEDPR